VEWRTEVRNLNIEGIEKGVTISAGVTTSDLAENETQLIEYADKALYESKRNGKNRVTIYTSATPENETAPVASEIEINDILSHIQSPIAEVRRQVANDLFDISCAKSLLHNTIMRSTVLSVIDRILADRDEEVRFFSLRILQRMFISSNTEIRKNLIDRYFALIVNKVNHDSSLRVRSLAMSTLGFIGDQTVVNWILDFICNCDNETYSNLRPVVALNNLKFSYDKQKIKQQLLHLLEESNSDFVSKRLIECLDLIRG